MKEKIKNLLRDLVLGKSIEELTKIYEYTRPYSVKRLIKHYEEKHIIEKINNNYKFTDEGLKLYQTIFLDVPKRQIEIHNISYKIKIENSYPDFLDYVEHLLIKQGIQIEKSGFGKSIFEFFSFGMRIRVTKDYVIVFPKKEIYGSTEECLQESEKSIEEITPKLEALFQIKLEQKGLVQLKLSKRHIAYIKHPLAQLVEKNGFRLEVFDDEGRRRLFSDNSDGKYHLETDRVDFGSSDMPKVEDNIKDVLNGFKMSDNFKDIKRLENNQEIFMKNFNMIESQIGKVTQNQVMFDANIKKHFKVLNKIGNAVDKLSKEVGKLKRK